MKKERFNQVIDLIIESLTKRIGICAVVRSLLYNEIITEDEHDEMKCRFDEMFCEMLDNDSPTYDAEGELSNNFTYLFPSNVERAVFLQQLKFKEDDKGEI